MLITPLIGWDLRMFFGVVDMAARSQASACMIWMGGGSGGVDEVVGFVGFEGGEPVAGDGDKGFGAMGGEPTSEETCAGGLREKGG